eukprot:TRINITY_DN17960_c0_g1_i1.p1 TRINITY_DN17960_c0_g1~~TRINITY_DN17960_c0_g1_i1.p1  ORF type:complete len:412 (+),score=98.39 TRINITY_DN17960_c0_g1_i1:397-1632(+)
MLRCAKTATNRVLKGFRQGKSAGASAPSTARASREVAQGSCNKAADVSGGYSADSNAPVQAQSQACAQTPALTSVLLQTTPPALHELQSEGTRGSGLVALSFLTSSRAAASPSEGVGDAVDGICRQRGTGAVLWNDEAWKLLVKDFEKRTGRALDSAFKVFRHDDSACDGIAKDSEVNLLASVAAIPDAEFFDRATLVPPVETARAGLSLVFAELRLLRAARSAGCEYALVLSGSCLPLCRLDELHQHLLGAGGSILQYHFCRGGQQRLLGVPYGSLQWKAWHARDIQLLCELDEAELRTRWSSLEAAMRRVNLAPDEVVLVNELFERGGSLEQRGCQRRAVTFCEWETAASSRPTEASGERGPCRARTFDEGVPEVAWQARAQKGALLCRKIAPMSQSALVDWASRLDML